MGVEVGATHQSLPVWKCFFSDQCRTHTDTHICCNNSVVCLCNNLPGAQRKNNKRRMVKWSPGQQNEAERPVGRTQTSGLLYLMRTQNEKFTPSNADWQQQKGPHTHIQSKIPHATYTHSGEKLTSVHTGAHHNTCECAWTRVQHANTLRPIIHTPRVRG